MKAIRKNFRKMTKGLAKTKSRETRHKDIKRDSRSESAPTKKKRTISESSLAKSKAKAKQMKKASTLPPSHSIWDYKGKKGVEPFDKPLYRPQVAHRSSLSQIKSQERSDRNFSMSSPGELASIGLLLPPDALMGDTVYLSDNSALRDSDATPTTWHSKRGTTSQELVSVEEESALLSGVGCADSFIVPIYDGAVRGQQGKQLIKDNFLNTAYYLNGDWPTRVLKPKRTTRMGRYIITEEMDELRYFIDGPTGVITVSLTDAIDKEPKIVTAFAKSDLVVSCGMALKHNNCDDIYNFVDRNQNVLFSMTLLGQNRAMQIMLDTNSAMCHTFVAIAIVVARMFYFFFEKTKKRKNPNVNNATFSKCSTCNGSGKITFRAGDMACHICKGSGKERVTARTSTNKNVPI